MASDQRYELGELFDGMSPETEMVYKAIGVVLTLVLIAIAFLVPFHHLSEKAHAGKHPGHGDPAAAAHAGEGAPGGAAEEPGDTGSDKMGEMKEAKDGAAGH